MGALHQIEDLRYSCRSEKEQEEVDRTDLMNCGCTAEAHSIAKAQPSTPHLTPDECKQISAMWKKERQTTIKDSALCPKGQHVFFWENISSPPSWLHCPPGWVASGSTPVETGRWECLDGEFQKMIYIEPLKSVKKPLQNSPNPLPKGFECPWPGVTVYIPPLIKAYGCVPLPPQKP